MFIKSIIPGLVAGFLLTGTAYSQMFIVLPDDSTDQGLPDGISDFASDFDGIDTQINIAKELTGDARNVEIPLEFAIVFTQPDLIRRTSALTFNIQHAEYLNIPRNDNKTRISRSILSTIGNCDASTTTPEVSYNESSLIIDVPLENTLACDDTIPETNGVDGPSAADILTHNNALVFTLPLVYANDISMFIDFVKFDINDGSSGRVGIVPVLDDSGKKSDIFEAVMVSRKPSYSLNYNKKNLSLASLFDNPVIGDVQITWTGALKPNLQPVTTSDLASASLTLSFEDMSGLDPANFRLVNEADGVSLSGTRDGNNIIFDIRDNIGQKLDVHLIMDEYSDALIQSQDITLSMNLDFISEDFIDQEKSYSFSSINHGGVYGPFEWVGDSDKGALSVFRFTNVSNPPPGMLMLVENTTNPIDDVLVPFTFPKGVVNGEAVVNSHQLTKAIGKFGRADISFIFDTDDPITVRRVFITPSGSISEMSTDYTVGGVSVE